MRVIVQRVRKASVSVNEKVVGKINYGYMLLVGFNTTDTESNVLNMVKKIPKIFPFT